MEIASPRGGFARWAHGRHAAPPVPPFYLSSRAPSRASRASSATHGLVAPLPLAGADRFETCLIVQNDHTLPSSHDTKTPPTRIFCHNTPTRALSLQKMRSWLVKP